MAIAVIGGLITSTDGIDAAARARRIQSDGYWVGTIARNPTRNVQDASRRRVPPNEERGCGASVQALARPGE